MFYSTRIVELMKVSSQVLPPRYRITREAAEPVPVDQIGTIQGVRSGHAVLKLSPGRQEDISDDSGARLRGECGQQRRRGLRGFDNSHQLPLRRLWATASSAWR